MIERPTLNISETVWTHARFRGSRTAFVLGDRRVTWSEFEKRVSKVANALVAGGLKKGDRVALLGLNAIQTLEVMYGTLRAGGVIVPLSALLTPGMIASLTMDSDARFFFTVFPLQGLTTPVVDKLNGIPRERRIAVAFHDDAWTDYEAFIASTSEVSPRVQGEDQDECVIIYSSGTTGTPKGIVHTNLARIFFAFAGISEFRINSSSITLINTPVFTNATWLMLLATVQAGGTSVLLPVFTPEAFLKTVQAEKCTHTFLVPTQYHILMQHPDFDKYDLSSLQIMVSMGSALPLPLKQEILQRMGKGLLELYGTTEGVGTTLKPEDIMAKTGSVGTPIAGTDVRIIDDAGNELPFGEIGEIVGSSFGMMKEYHNQHEATEEIIWRDQERRVHLRTGDVGRFDEDGFLYILDRKKDMIVSGGLNVFPADIEEVLFQHPDVDEVAVIAIPDEKWGERPLALVRRRPGATATAEALAGWVNARVAKHQRVRAVEFRDEPFPRNALGKLLKRQLRDPYWPKRN